MKKNQWEIIILKPTPVFQAFIASQCPDVEAPDYNLLKTDTTAYIIPRQADDESTLNLIESNFKRMFHFEISRWLGDEVQHDIKGSFLDFLCCFKFELHSQMVLLEKEIQDVQQLFCVRPRSILLQWMRSMVQNQPELHDVLERVEVSHLAENATVVLKNFVRPDEVKNFIRVYYPDIYSAEMLRMCDQVDHWPKLENYQDFMRYFTIDIHSQVVHLS
ncbi:MAG: hypothetical protein JJT82_00315 [Legionellaceae bacterium]|nr:hypothetical protein [Legionellaceae bacterium]